MHLRPQPRPPHRLQHGLARISRRIRLGLPGANFASILLLGAGGAGNAIGYAALQLGVERLFLFDQNQDRAAKLANLFNAPRVVPTTDPYLSLQGVDGLIHATPVGMTGHPGMVIPPDWLRPDLWVADVVYFPLETELLRTARRLGCQTLHGGGMAVLQAAEAFRIFTGIEPDHERML